MPGKIQISPSLLLSLGDTCFPLFFVLKLYTFPKDKSIRGYSSAGERLTHIQEAAGSKPAIPTSHTGAYRDHSRAYSINLRPYWNLREFYPQKRSFVHSVNAYC